MRDGGAIKGVAALLSPSLHQRPAATLVLVLADFEDEVRRRAGRLPGEQSAASGAADLGHRALRAPVSLAHPEDDGIDEGECVIEHQAFDFTVGWPAPILADDERPADLDLMASGVIAVVAARTDQPGGRAVDEHKTHLRCHRALEELAEWRFGVAIRRGMHFPDQRIGAGGE